MCTVRFTLCATPQFSKLGKHTSNCDVGGYTLAGSYDGKAKVLTD